MIVFIVPDTPNRIGMSRTFYLLLICIKQTILIYVEKKILENLDSKTFYEKKNLKTDFYVYKNSMKCQCMKVFQFYNIFINNPH